MRRSVAERVSVSGGRNTESLTASATPEQAFRRPLLILTLNVWNNEGDQPVDGVWANDHFGVVVDLKIGKNE